MILTNGVYTVTCPECKAFTIMHLGSDKLINPRFCSGCEIEFESILSGEQRHTFIGLVKKEEEKRNKIIVNKEVEEKTKETEKKSFIFSKTKGTSKKLLKRKKDQKDWQKIF